MLPGQVGSPNFFEEGYIFQERLAKGLVFDILQDRYGLMWFGTEYGLIRYDGHEARAYVHEPDNPHSLAGNVITTIAEDPNGDLWIGTQNSGLHHYDRGKDQFFRYQADLKAKHSISHNKISQVLVEDVNSIWVATEGGGVNHFRKDTQTFTVPDIEPVAPSSFSLLKDTNGQLWMGNFYGLNRWLPEEELFASSAQVPPPYTDFNSLKVLALDQENIRWAGFRNGGLKQLSSDQSTFLDIQCSPSWPQHENTDNIWDIQTSSGGGLLVATDGALLHLQRQAAKATYTLSEYKLTQERRFLSVYETPDGVLWIGTNDGLIVLAPRHKVFQLLQPRTTAESSSIERGITSMARAGTSGIWMGTIKGVWKFDPKQQLFQQDLLLQHPILQRFASENISALLEDSQGHLWLAIIQGFNTGFSLYRYDLQRKEIKEYSQAHTHLYSFATIDIYEDINGNIWLANHGGLIQFDVGEEKFTVTESRDQQGGQVERQRINTIRSFSNNRLLLGTNSHGVYTYQLDNQRLDRLTIDTIASTIKMNTRILDFAYSASKLWIGTAGGLFRWDEKVQQIHGFDQRHGLADNVVKTILPDQEGQLWVATQSALAKWDPNSQNFIAFNEGDGLEMEEFWDRSGILGDDGLLYFGGDNGLLVLDPRQIQQNTYRPPIAITKFELFNRPLSPAGDSSILSASIEQQPTIYLQHHQNVFTIHYAALSFINPERNEYAIKMEGFQEDWQNVGTETQATYTNLNPGTYTFRVKASNNDRIWNEEGTMLSIVVAPPWYRTWWAWTSYIILFSAVILVFYNFQLQQKIAQVEARRLQDLDAVKTELYTHITHEFRTPLSLIQGPVERALNDQQYQLGQKELAIIRNNCRRLLKLIQQILNLNKLEANALELKFGHGDIVPSIKFIVDAFSSFAASQEIELQFSSSLAQLEMDFAPESLTDLFSNLLLNACKYTPPGGKVLVDLRQVDAHINIAISDTGKGIPESDIDRIFDPFYQVDQDENLDKTESIRNSTGIGLSMAKRLAELMGGQLTVTSEVGVGSCFMLVLPIKKEHKDRPIQVPEVAPYVPPLPITTFVSGRETEPDAPEILVVDDNVEMANFIANCLPRHFKITLAYDGKEGIRQAQENIPDLIISDVMMPKVDGFELTETLKQDIRTSHIPIILLTAKANFTDRLEGLKKGSEVYLTKPFDQEELLIQVENLLDTRRRLQQYYLRQSGVQKSQASVLEPDQVEDQFLQKVKKSIEENIDNNTYSVEALARNLHLSPSQLYRKMMALTGQSTIKFFRSVQLSKAVDLLRDTDLNISEIAYLCGFNEPAYFSRVFTAEYGCSPSQFRERGPTSD